MSASPLPAAGRRDSHSVESLLSVAVSVFNVRGYDGTSMEDLARAAGITKSSIYHHVSGKEELLRLSVTRALDGLFAILGESGARQGRAADRLEYVVRRTCLELVEKLPHVTLLLRVRGNTDAERDALERRREFDRRVAQLAAEAVAEGDLRAGLDPRLTARLVFGMVNSICEWYRPHGDAAESNGAAAGGEAAGLADAVTALVFDGLRARPRT
ncbi:TetR/AcrR family transcriptional regulator [Actinocrinis puniceicyclus]|uniref:TetR/AcrR family transcriptional regulator n=1 Tax=Actinocrinis puniceicyclus TaxID=977794 RepID=UPI0028AC4E2C|nr:TetR/AcrR family transcriptional regulator [Actinocrinis puniceicyclus]